MKKRTFIQSVLAFFGSFLGGWGVTKIVTQDDEYAWMVRAVERLKAANGRRHYKWIHPDGSLKYEEWSEEFIRERDLGRRMYAENLKNPNKVIWLPITEQA